jgi:hypothetical protein
VTRTVLATALVAALVAGCGGTSDADARRTLERAAQDVVSDPFDTELDDQVAAHAVTDDDGNVVATLATPSDRACWTVKVVVPRGWVIDGDEPIRVHEPENVGAATDGPCGRP